MTIRSPEEIKAKFLSLRLVCDKRGHPLLEELESLALRDNALLAVHDRIHQVCEQIANPGHSVKVWEQDARSVSLPDVGGYTAGSAKAEHLALVESGER